MDTKEKDGGGYEPVELGITPEMIEAGAEVLRSLALGLSGEASEVAEDVLLAALPLADAVRSGALILVTIRR